MYLRKENKKPGDQLGVIVEVWVGEDGGLDYMLAGLNEDLGNVL